MRFRITHDPRPRPSAGRRHAVAAACSAALVAGGVAACGSAGDDPAGHAAAGACAPSRLKVTVDVSAAGAAAGSTYYPIDFTNSSAASCRLDGYPAAWFATSAGQRLGAAAVWDHGVSTRPVTLAPGATAHSWLQVTAAANYPARECRPVTARMLLISAPGVTSASRIMHAFPACAGNMHGHGILRVQPVLPGRGSRGAT